MEEEAEHLRKRFEGVNRAQFARDYQIKGGQANIYNHVRGLRPLNLDAARKYARGFGCTLAEISPRLAREVEAAAQVVGRDETAPERGSDGSKARSGYDWPLTLATIERLRALTPQQRKRADAALDDLLRGYEAERAAKKK